MQRPWVPYAAGPGHMDHTVPEASGQPGGISRRQVSGPLLQQHSASLPLQLDTGKTFQAVMRFDTDVELTYFRNGGILNYMIRKMAQ